MLVLVVAVAVLALGLAAWRLSRPPTHRGSGDLALHELAPGVYMYRGFFSNSAVLVTPRAVVVVDTQVSPVAARRLRALIARVTPLPITTVVNTHYHGDHSGGNALFPGAEIIATEDCARYVVERDAERVEYANQFGLAFQEVHPTIGPTRTFAGRLELDVGGERLEVLQLGRVETPDACIVHWPARGVVAVGDGVATWEYPYLGVPFLDEGLRDDGSWIEFLEAVKALRPRVLIAGHGPAIVGERAIAARLDLLIGLYRDLIASVARELAAGTPVPAIVTKVQAELRRYPARRDLRERTTSQRFAIFRCVNNCTPGRAGKGWWDDLRPSIIVRATAAEAARELEALGDRGAVVRARAAVLVASGKRPLAIALLEAHTARSPGDAPSLGLLADVLFDGAEGIRPSVDATEYIAAATRAARAALAVDPKDRLGLLIVGAAEAFGGMVLAQPMAPAIAKLEAALARGLTDKQRRKALFFLGKAHQMEQRDAEADRCFRQVLPAWARPIYPLVRERLRAYP